MSDEDRGTSTDDGPSVLDPRGDSGDAAGEHEAVRAALEATATDRTSRVMVWRPRRQVAFGRRDERRDGYPSARAAAEERGYRATRRTAGGHAVVHDGGTVAAALAVPVAAGEVAIEDRYCAAIEAVEAALGDVGVAVASGEPDGSFCPGDHGLTAGGGKLVGVAQRVRREAALVSCVVAPAPGEEALAVYRAVYDALDLAFDAGTVAARPDVDADAVADALRRRLAAVGAG